jgi:predicted amidohydrolase
MNQLASPKSRKYNVGLIQMSMGADPEANLAAALTHVREAARLGANVICLPELFRAQYFCQREDTRGCSTWRRPFPARARRPLARLRARRALW